MFSRPDRWLILLAAGFLAAGVAWIWQGASSPQEDAALVRVPPGRFSYRLSGEFSRAGQPIDAPLREVTFPNPVSVMRNLVTEADYEKCVTVGACDARNAPYSVRPDFPVTGVSWADARVYARWLSQKTGQAWRVPTDAEWSYVAGSRYHDDALLLGEDADVVTRWMARYDREAKRDMRGNAPERLGTFGANDYGLNDLAGNVWEWTDSCFTRQDLENGSKPFAVCGIRVVAGQHRTYLSDFIRDARGGGCATGIPPSNLGFRLIRDEPSSLRQRLRGWAGM